MRSGFTPEETDAILAKHYPWALKGSDMKKFKCIECGENEVEYEGASCKDCDDCAEFVELE